MKFEIFVLQKFPIFPILIIPQYVFKTILWYQKKNQEKILSSFRDIPEKKVFSHQFFFQKTKLRNLLKKKSIFF